MAARPALTSASAPFSMTRRLPLPARRTFASIDRTTGSRSGRWPLFPTCSAAAIFARLSWISIRSAATVIRSTIFWTRLFSSTGGIASHRLESVRALRRAASSAYASRSSGARVSLTSVLDDNNASQPVEHQRLNIPRRDAHPFLGSRVIPIEKRRRDVIAVSLGSLFGMGRRHRVAVGIDDQAGQQARRLRAHRQGALLAIGRELALHDLPKLRIEDGLVLAGVGFALVNNVAPVDPVLQHQ